MMIMAKTWMGLWVIMVVMLLEGGGGVVVAPHYHQQEQQPRQLRVAKGEDDRAFSAIAAKIGPMLADVNTGEWRRGETGGLDVT